MDFSCSVFGCKEKKAHYHAVDQTQNHVEPFPDYKGPGRGSNKHVVLVTGDCTFCAHLVGIPLNPGATAGCKACATYLLDTSFQLRYAKTSGVWVAKPNHVTGANQFC